MGQNDGPKNGTTKFINDKNSVIESLVSGSISSTITTVVYQPLELLKTRIQLRDETVRARAGQAVIGRATKSALFLVQSQGLSSLWKGTGASLLRSGPGVGIYYALLSTLQANLSGQGDRPDSATQAFFFGITARSMVSFILLPVTVVKVRYESGLFSYPSLMSAIKTAYASANGWSGLVPTVLRDSLFSGTYYMCYTWLKAERKQLDAGNQRHQHLRTFSYGIVSGLVASLITNPIDVIKTNIQVAASSASQSCERASMRSVISKLASERGGYLRFFDGLVPRSARRTLISASTWTFYELMIQLAHSRRQ